VETEETTNSSRMTHKDKSVFHDIPYIGENTGGLYTIIPPLPPVQSGEHKGKRLVKIGSTTSITQRTYQYHGFYPEGMGIFALLLIPRKKGEETKKYSNRLETIERQVHNQLDYSRLYNNQRKEGEFFTATDTEVEKAFMKVWKENNRHRGVQWFILIFKNPKHSTRTEGVVYHRKVKVKPSP